MNLEENYLLAYEELKSILENNSPTSSKALSLIDLTLLDETVDDETLANLSKKANRYHVAAICVFPQHIKQLTASPEVKIATVVNFPDGDQSTKQVLSSIEALLTMTVVDEIDYVFPHQIYLEGETKSALSQCQQAYQLCHQANVTFKVILETGALPSLDFIYHLSLAVIDTGCDFLKTSTGKIAQGATPSAAFTILKAIKDRKTNCGLKVSGGIKKPEQAFTYMALAKQILERDLDKSWFRIGASSLLDELTQPRL